MTNEPTIEKLHQLRLYTMASAWTTQQANPTIQDLAFDERLAMLVDAETLARDNRRLTKLLYDAKLRLIARQGLMLMGHERMTPGSGPTIEFVQGWWARPASRQGSDETPL